MVSTDILVPTDFRHGSRTALLRAMHSLGAEGGHICILHVLDQHLLEDVQALTPEVPREELRERLRQRAQERYAALVAGLDPGPIELELVIVEGVPSLKIVQIARDFATDMIVMSVHRGPDHFEQVLFGSTAERVLRIAPCPVLIVPDTIPDTAEANQKA